MKYLVEGGYVELYFDSVPAENIRGALKVCGWKWFGKKRCWSNRLNDENLIFAKKLCEDMRPKQQSGLLSLDKRVITMGDLVVRSNSFYCNKHHDMMDVAGEFEVRDRNGNVSNYLVPLAYCQSCNTLFVLEGTYQELKKRGIIVGQILSYKEHQKGMRLKDDTDEWEQVSPLRKWGYTVSQVEGCTDRQRQAILEDIVDYGGLSKDKVLSYLDFFIRLNKQKGLVALDKWKMDREHLANYRLGSAERVRIGNITVLE